MKINSKELLSEHVETIFKQYSESGLHICDIATGGGKSYTIGKLTCEYYPEHFDRIVILCVQNKLVLGMNKEIEKFVHSENSLLNDSDKLVIENNIEVALNALQFNHFSSLIEEMEHRVAALEDSNKNLRFCVSKVRKAYDVFKDLASLYRDRNGKGDYLQDEITKGESILRNRIREFFHTYKRHLEHAKNVKSVSVQRIIKEFPSLRKVYPQVDIASKKVLLMTVHKAMYGIDPILTDYVNLTNISEKNKKTLIFFDESDQAATAMRDTIIDQSIKDGGNSLRFAKGYNAYLQYQKLISNYDQVYDDCYGDSLAKSVESALTITNKNWSRTFGDIPTYNNIFLSSVEELENYRRGVFFSGPILRLNVSEKKTHSKSFVCYKKGAKHFVLEHCNDEETLKKVYQAVVPMGQFLSLVMGNTTSIKSHLRQVVMDSLKKNREAFHEDIKEQKEGTSISNTYMGYPSLDTEIHSLFSRFETTGEGLYEHQLNDFITNRKNLRFENQSEKMPDFTVYSQGVQLYLEEIDERDNQRRVRLSLREISTTPEKILVDLVMTSSNSVVLCSATSSCRSVVSNFDITYLKQVLGDRVKPLSEGDRKKFDDLMEQVSPSHEEHTIEVVPVEHYAFTDQRLNHVTLPDEYKAMFSKKAQDDKSAERWFNLTKRKLENQRLDSTNVTFHLYRLLQFVKAYHFFFTHDDIHSMIYFQNKTGDKDKEQFNIISCLIEGNYPYAIEDELPSDWENDHIRTSKDWEEVEGSVLKELSTDKNAKIMLISAYGSFKAGANLQYDIPDGLDVVSGDNWKTDGDKMKKDWDAMFLQAPTSYLVMNEDGETSAEKSLYNAMLVLMMLFERGCLSRSEVSEWLSKALAGNFMFSEKNSVGIIKDKAAWTQTIIEQAIGRLCRTRNKPKTTYILYDETMVDAFDAANYDKSLTDEFKVLAANIAERQSASREKSPEEVILCNLANESAGLIKNMLKNALRYTVHINDDNEYDFEDGEEDYIPHVVRISQMMNQSFKRTIIKKPVISSLEELDDSDKQTTFIAKCYGAWNHHGNNGFRFRYNSTKEMCVTSSNKESKNYTINVSTVRLDVLMRNPVVRKHFQEHGYAIDWEKDGLILHPEILAHEYVGEIGEEAFKALAVHYCGVQEDDLKHLEGRDYELADFVLMNQDGSYKIAFDVKNMRSQGHNDGINDMNTTEKRQKKSGRLGCPLYTVNILKLDYETIDVQHEIGGLLTNDGEIVPQAIQHLRRLIKG